MSTVSKMAMVALKTVMPLKVMASKALMTVVCVMCIVSTKSLMTMISRCLLHTFMTEYGRITY